MSRADDARLEAHIEERRLIDLGLLDPDQPTPQSHARYQRRMTAEFTPVERQIIRAVLGLGESDR